MDVERGRRRLGGCYITIPTMFRDPDLELDLPAIRRHVGWLMERGIDARYGTFLAGGAAGDFSTMTFDERVEVAATVVEAADGRVPVAMGAQTTSTMELRRLAKAAAGLGAEFIQVSCPFYFLHTEEDFYEYVAEAAAAADIGIIVYNTFWTSAAVSFRLIERVIEIPNVVGLKWACPRTDAMEFEDVVSTFADRLTIIDNHLMFAMSAMLGARAFEVHLCNYWPEWGIRLIDAVEAGRWQEIQRMLVRRGDALLQALGRDREDLHQWRRLSGQALHGAGRPQLEPVPAADPRRPRPLPRALPRDDAGDGRAGRAAAHDRAPRPFLRLAADDNVAVAMRKIAQGETVELGGVRYEALDEMPLGHKMALVPIAAGPADEKVRGADRQGDADDRGRRAGPCPQHRERLHRERCRPFRGLERWRRARTGAGCGRTGARASATMSLVAYLVECAHHVARAVATPFEGRGVELIGFSGCYPSAYAQDVMDALCTHPNVGAVLLVSLGCEEFDRSRLEGVDPRLGPAGRGHGDPEARRHAGHGRGRPRLGRAGAGRDRGRSASADRPRRT